jgi:polyferredoxin
MEQKRMNKKQFHKHFATKGLNLYWIIIAYIALGWFFPVVGLIAFVCMIGPVLTSIWRGRYWCGNICPRGNMYDRLLSKYSPHKPIPKFVRTFGFRLFMVFFIFVVFGVQMYFAWGDWNAMGRVFWRIIVMTTVVGVILSFVYAPVHGVHFAQWVQYRRGCLQRISLCQVCIQVCILGTEIRLGLNASPIT